MMTEQEIFAKNLILSTEFDRYVLEHPDFAEKIPDNAQVVLLSALSYKRYQTQQTQ